MEASHSSLVKNLLDIANIGKAMTRDFLILGISSPSELKNQDPYLLYTKLSTMTCVQQDPCVLDTFIVVINFMNGAPRRPWYYYTEQRKARYGKSLRR